MSTTLVPHASSPFSKSLSVEFYPAVDDYVYVASRINSSAEGSTASTYGSYFFVIINVISFPAYLWISNHFFAGTAVFLINVALIIFFIPTVNKSRYKEYYEQLIGKREKHIAKVELSNEGLRYTHDQAETFYLWGKFKTIEESTESIFFFYEGYGFGVRKSGFAYIEQQVGFLEFAKRSLAVAQANGIVS